VIRLRRVVRLIRRPSLSNAQHMPVSPPGESRGVVRILHQRGIEQCFRSLEDSARGIVHILLGTQKEIVGFEAVWPLYANSFQFGGVQMGGYLSNDHLGQTVLDLEEVKKSFVELGEPERRAQLSIGQLDRQTQTIAEDPHTSGENVANPQYIADLAWVTILVPESQRRQPRNHEEIRNPREGFDQVLDETFGDEVMRRLAGEVAKRQNRDRRSTPRLVREVVERSGDRIVMPLDLPADGERSGGAIRRNLARIGTNSTLRDHRCHEGRRIDPYSLVDGGGLLRRGQVEHGQKRLPTTLEFANRLGAVAHLGKGAHQVAHGTLVGRFKVDQAACRRRAHFRFRILPDQAVEFRLENLPYAILEPCSLGGEPVVERGRNPVEIFEEALAVGLDEIAEIRCWVNTCIEDRKRIDPALPDINSNAVAADLDEAGNVAVDNAVELRE